MPSVNYPWWSVPSKWWGSSSAVLAPHEGLSSTSSHAVFTFLWGLSRVPNYRCSHRGHTRSRTLPSDYMISKRWGSQRSSRLSCPRFLVLFTLRPCSSSMLSCISELFFHTCGWWFKPPTNATSTLQVLPGCHHSNLPMEGSPALPMAKASDLSPESDGAPSLLLSPVHLAGWK